MGRRKRINPINTKLVSSYIRTYIHTYIHTHTYILTHIHAYIHTYWNTTVRAKSQGRGWVKAAICFCKYAYHCCLNAVEFLIVKMSKL